jgi:hypothetical protein
MPKKLFPGYKIIPEDIENLLDEKDNSIIKPVGKNAHQDVQDLACQTSIWR